MKVVRAEQARFAGPKAHREGGIAFRYLLEGREGALDNYALMLVDIEDAFATPRHRHNFEQVRIMLDGSFGFGPDKTQATGSVGYFCEGTWYTQSAQGRSTTLLLQVAGPSGHGYMSAGQLDRGIAEISANGTFANGRFRSTGDDGAPHDQDGYEAVWEHVFERRIAYPAPRYDAPVLMQPANFSFVPDLRFPGVARKSLASFNERGLSIAQLRMRAGSRFESTTRQPVLLYCTAGEGTAGGEAWSSGSAIEQPRGERVVLQANADSDFYVLGLPTFDDR
jgi:hypothetical protein